MKEAYSEVLARHAGPESYAGGGNTVGVATTGVHAGPVLSSENRIIPCADVVQTAEGTIECASDGKHSSSTAESKTWCMYGNSKRENREIPSVPRLKSRRRLVSLTEGTTNVYAGGKSDDFVVPPTRANKTATCSGGVRRGKEVTEGKRRRIAADVPDSEPDQASLGAARRPRQVTALCAVTV